MKNFSRATLVFVFMLVALSTCSNTQPTIEQMYEEIVCNEIKHPEIVLAQSINECGWDYDSYNARKRYNFFGMTGGKKCESNKFGYKIFSHWTESVHDYKLWQEKNYKSEGDYFYFLERIGYASSHEYCSDLKVILRLLLRKRVINECGL